MSSSRVSNKVFRQALPKSAQQVLNDKLLSSRHNCFKFAKKLMLLRKDLIALAGLSSYAWPEMLVIVFGPALTQEI